ncbi:MAG: hypothetical protein MOGMAGMI_00272 [Candidatus Omnitrophica bacterium]|nr:hypothetical protein [Candidatus Omnitrophota bacterium]
MPGTGPLLLEQHRNPDFLAVAESVYSASAGARLAQTDRTETPSPLPALSTVVTGIRSIREDIDRWLAGELGADLVGAVTGRIDGETKARLDRSRNLANAALEKLRPYESSGLADRRALQVVRQSLQRLAFPQNATGRALSVRRDTIVSNVERLVAGARLAAVPAGLREEVGEELKALRQIVRNFPRSGATDYQRTHALLTALQGGSVQYLRRDETGRYTQIRFEGLRGLRELVELRTAYGRKLLTAHRSRIIDELIAEAETALRGLGIDPAHAYTLVSDPELQNPFIHTFIGSFDTEAGISGRLQSAAQVANLSPDDVDYLRSFVDVTDATQPTQIHGQPGVYEPFSLRIRHNIDRGSYLDGADFRGPAKGGVRFISSGMLREDPVFTSRFERLETAEKPEGGKGTVVFADVFERGTERFVADFPTTDAVFRARTIRNYVRDLYQKNKLGYNIDVPAPDTGSRATDMDIMTDELLRQYLSRAIREGAVDQWEDRTFAARIIEVHRQATTATHPENTLINTPYLTAVSEYLADLRRQGRQGPGSLPASVRPLAQLTSVFTSKTVRHGGSEFRDNSTGYGVVFTLKESLKREAALKAALQADGKAVTDEKPLEGLTVSVIGFGGVGIPAIEQFVREGARVQAISEGARGILIKEGGFTLEDIQTLRRLRAETGGFKGLNTAGYAVDGAVLRTGADAEKDFYQRSVDVLVPAALENMINVDNVDLVNARIIAEGANGAITNDAYYAFTGRGGFVLSDVLANGGGVTVSYLEWLQNLNNEQWNADTVRSRQEQLQSEAVAAVYAVKAQYGTDLRTAIDIYAFKQILASRDASPVAGARLAQEVPAQAPVFTQPEVDDLALFGIRTSAAIGALSAQRPAYVPYLLGNRLAVITLTLDPTTRSVSLRLGTPRDVRRPLQLVDIGPARTFEQRSAQIALSEAPQLQQAAARLAADTVDTASARLTETVRQLIEEEADLAQLPSVRHLANQGPQQLLVDGVRAFTSFAGSKTGVFAVSSEILFDADGWLKVPDLAQAAHILNRALEVHDITGDIVIAVYGDTASVEARGRVETALKNLQVVAPRLKFTFVDLERRSQTEDLTGNLELALGAKLQALGLDPGYQALAIAYQKDTAVRLNPRDKVSYVEVEPAQEAQTFNSAMLILLSLTFADDFSLNRLPAELRGLLSVVTLRDADGRPIRVFLMKPMKLPVDAMLRLIDTARRAVQSSA